MNKLHFSWIWLSFLLIIFSATCIYFYLQKNTFTTYPVASLASPFLFPEEEPPASDTISLVFAGDIMLDRDIRLKATKNGYDYLLGPNISALLKKADYSIANLEGPVTNSQSISVGSEVGSTKNYIFTFAPESALFLASKGISIVNLGNNHILNFGAEGLAATYDYLDQAGVKYFGYTGAEQPADKFIFKTKDNYSIGFVNYNQFIWNGEEQAFADIAALRPDVDYLVLYAHWGNEYLPENQVLINLAHKFVDLGADTVIGSHPHIITGNEMYKDKPLYYSIGNFIFDQYFEDAVRKGLVLELMIESNTSTTTVIEHQVYLDPKGFTELIEPKVTSF